jgi:AsmA protein
VKFSFSLRDGVLSIHEFEAEIGGGVVRGEFEAILQAPVPDLTLKLATRGVDVGALLRGFAKTGFLTGPMDSEWELRGPWAQDLEEMLRHIEGKADIRISSGTIHGVDIPRMIRSFGLLGRKEKDDRDASTHFSKGSATLLFHRGIIKVSRGSMESEGVRIMAAGEADLMRRSLDFRLEPEMGSGAEGSSSVLVAPIWVSGSFSHPTFRPDLAGIRKRGEGPIKLSLPSKGELREMKKRLKEFLKPP